MSDVEARLVRIEQEVRTWRAVAFAAGAVAIVACVLAVRVRAPEAPKELRLHHTDGQTAMVLSPKSLRFFAPGGNVVAELLPGESTELRLSSADASQRVAVRADKTGSSVNIGSAKGGPQVALQASPVQADVLAETEKSTVRATADEKASNVAIGRVDSARAIIRSEEHAAHVEVRDEQNGADVRVADHVSDVWITRDGVVRPVHDLFTK